MRLWVYFIILIVFVNAVGIYFDLSWWAFIGIFVPLYVLGTTFLTTMYNTRASLKPEPVPAGYAGRVKDIDKEIPALAKLGFVRKDAYYIKYVLDAVVNVFQLGKVPVYLYLAHFGQKKAYFFITHYTNDVTLETSRDTSTGMIKRPPKKLLQVFPRISSYRDLLVEHKKAHDFLLAKGLKFIEMPLGIRGQAEKGLKEFSAHVRAIPFWPVKLVYWTITGRGRVHAKPLADQVDAGLVGL